MTDAPREIWNTVDGAEIKYIRADIAQEYLMQALAADGQAQEAYEKMQAEYKRGWNCRDIGGTEMNDDGGPGPKEGDRLPIFIALIVLAGVAFYSFLIGAGFIYALVWASWI